MESKIQTIENWAVTVSHPLRVDSVGRVLWAYVTVVSKADKDAAGGEFMKVCLMIIEIDASLYHLKVQ